MTKRQAKKLAWAAIASLVDVNLTTGDGDLFAGMDQYEPADQTRIIVAMWECLALLKGKGEE